jgi:hypothetical protein
VRIQAMPEKLPVDFADSVLDLELMVDKGEFDLETIN